MTTSNISKSDYTPIPSSNTPSFLPPTSPPYIPSPSLQYLLPLPFFFVILLTILYLNSLPVVDPDSSSITHQQSSSSITIFYNYTQVRAETLSCTPPLLCSAMLLIEHSSSATILYAGYMISALSVSPLPVDSATRHLVAGTNSTVAADLAHQLVAALKSRFQAEMCDVDTAKVATAVQRGATFAALCMHTNDPMCFSDAAIAYC